MSENIKISIVVPIYNVEKYLSDCVKSLIEQTYDNIEILLVDDGSTDGCGEICDAYANLDSRVRVIHQSNGGVSIARNTGVKNAKGEYVLFIDPDDWFEKNTVEILVNEIKGGDIDVLRFNYVKEYGDYSQENKNSLLEEKVYQDEEFNQVLRKNVGLVGKELRSIENFNFLASVCFGCYKKSIILDNNIEFTDIDKIGSFEDGLFNLQFLMKAKSFVYIDKCLYHYRKNNAGAYTSRSKKNFFEKTLVLFNEIAKVIEDKLEDKQIQQAYFNRIAYCVLEQNLNVMKNREATGREKRKEIRAILKHDLVKKAIKQFKLKYLPLKWKVYYFFVKTKCTFGVYFVTKAILKLKGRK
ncbi:MAG: glycosyltransferase [Clostridia bacterium]|nr:glycosyltransferase [Clostridia bacterium]